MTRIITHYDFHTGKLAKPLTLAVISDLHNEPYEDLFPLIEGADALLVPGDISDRYRQQFDRGVAFLADAAKRLPTWAITRRARSATVSCAVCWTKPARRS